MEFNKEFSSNLEENSSSSSKILCYGCTIFLNFYDHHNNKFICFTNGFNKHKIRLKLFENSCQNGDYIKGLFKIFPAFVNKEYNEMKNKYFKETKQINSLTNYEKRSNFIF